MRMILSRLIPAVMHGIGLFASMLSHGATPVGVLSIEAATSVPPLARGFGGTPQQGDTGEARRNAYFSSAHVF
jgi:hypothetical protein